MDMLESVTHAHTMRSFVQEMGGDLDPTGLVLLRLTRLVANQFEMLSDEHLRCANLSGPRLGLLIRLMAEEEYGTDTLGTSPTHLSRCQQVSKNTISALLRGLEEQGLIERTLDASDKRVFRIRVSEAGRELVKATAPSYLAYLNDLISALTCDEQEQFRALLDKLRLALTERGTLTREAPRVQEEASSGNVTGGFQLAGHTN